MRLVQTSIGVARPEDVLASQRGVVRLEKAQRSPRAAAGGAHPCFVAQCSCTMLSSLISAFTYRESLWALRSFDDGPTAESKTDPWWPCCGSFVILTLS